MQDRSWAIPQMERPLFQGDTWVIIIIIIIIIIIDW